jgi:hypothetical protein
MKLHLRLFSLLPFFFTMPALAESGAQPETATSLPTECVKRIQQVAALVPGDDGTISQAADVKISHVHVLKKGVGSANGVPFVVYSLRINVADFKGTANLSDAAGACYIQKFAINAP